ncbi:restriction endonuclease subunit S [Aquimonas voraii]|uniref:restriction endonuclease subunit S n=1 Tax=Aquimonas voraii TaxID=265719 RepID=UPI001C40A3D0|nr:restriction endonuclease subunit S [Aquimonas voraii]
MTLQRGHDLPDEKRRPGCTPVLGSFGITGWHDEAKARGPGVTVGRSGASFGVVSYTSADYWPLNTALYVIDFHGNDERFAYYFLKQFDFTGYNSGSAQPSLNRNFIHPVPVDIPPVVEQRAIAHILGTLDDKIELNRRRNQTLEAMARALFKDWFVDFGPVRAKMEGREPYLPADLWQLFPDRLDDEGKPDGWSSVRLDDALVLQRGFDLPASSRTQGPYPVVAASGINGYHDKYMVKGPGVTTGRSGVLGRVFLIDGDFWPLNTSLWVKEFKRVSPYYAFELLRGLDFEMFNAGSAVPTLNRNHVHNLQIIAPPSRLIDAFDAQLMPMRKAQKKNEDECSSLANLRDTLLPKLISGELRISDAETFRERVT